MKRCFPQINFQSVEKGCLYWKVMGGGVRSTRVRETTIKKLSAKISVLVPYNIAQACTLPTYGPGYNLQGNFLAPWLLRSATKLTDWTIWSHVDTGWPVPHRGSISQPGNRPVRVNMLPGKKIYQQHWPAKRHSCSEPCQKTARCFLATSTKGM